MKFGNNFSKNGGKMLNKFLAFSLVSLIMIIVSGCSSTTIQTQQSVKVNYNVDPEIEVMMDKKITASAYRGYLFGFIPVSGDNNYLYYTYNYKNEDQTGYENIKAAANFNAIRKAPESDVVISPEYSVIVDNYFIFYKRITVNVTGYAGKIKGFRHKTCD